MLFITERSTTQSDLRNGQVLQMVSLFCVAYPHEAFAVEQDKQAFVDKARQEGRLLLTNPTNQPETIEMSRTRKGFLIKVWYIDHVGQVPAPTTLEEAFNQHEKAIDAKTQAEKEEVFKPIRGFENYEFSNKGNVRSVKTGNLIRRDGNSYRLYKDGESKYVNIGDLEAQYEA